MKHAARDHAKYSGSSAARTLACAAWVRLSAGLPARGETDAAEEGTEAHELLDECVRRGFERVPKHLDADKEYAEAVDVVLDYLTNLHIVHGFDDLVLCNEVSLLIPQRVVPLEDAATTPDLLVYSLSSQHAWSIDFKYGAGNMVEAADNAQLLCGAIAGFHGLPVAKLTCTVIQPRGWHPKGAVREWVTDRARMGAFRSEFEMAIARAEAGGDPTPGPHCKYCPAAVMCPAFEQRAVSVLQPGAATYEQIPPTLPAPSSIPMERIARIMQFAPAVRDWLKEIERYAYEQARSGANVPGHKLVEAQDRRRYNGAPADLASRIFVLGGGALSPDAIMPPALAPITKIEAELVKIARAAALPGMADDAARVMRDRFAFLTTKASSGNLSLVPVSDPRPAADRAAQSFKGVVIPPLPQ